MKQKQPILVAHRGYPARYPENTLIGIEAALHCGARAIEFDVQFSADGVPMLFHDEMLERVTGESGRIMETNFAQLKTLNAYEPQRFQDRYRGTPLNTLAELVELMTEYPSVEIFVEIKRHSLAWFGVERVIDTVIAQLAPIREHCFITSFEAKALAYSRQAGFEKIAWVMRSYDADSRTIAESLKPDFLLCDMDKTPSTPDSLWPGSWRWMLYETGDPVWAKLCLTAGAAYVETDDIGGMLSAMSTDSGFDTTHA
jgi:glycerophosphoryl diester phosphodiesterase